MSEELKEMNQLEKRVFNLLPQGADNLISTREIEDILHIDKRYVMEIIENLVIEYHLPIGSSRNSDNFGYFIATNEQEKAIGTYSLNKQINTMKKRAEIVENANLKTAKLYKEKYKDEVITRDKQLDLFYYVNIDGSSSKLEPQEMK